MYTTVKIAEIRARGHVPILAGGTGLYVDAVVFDYQFGPPADVEMRKKFEEMSLEELHSYCIKNNIIMPENHKNKRYVIRAIEQKSINNKRRNDPLENTIIVGITTNKDDLYKKIEQRANKIFDDNVIDEAKKLGEKYGWKHQSMSGNIYPLCQLYIENSITLEELKYRFIVMDRRLAKRQLTWFRRNEYIKWLSIPEAKDYLISLLASEH